MNEDLSNFLKSITSTEDSIRWKKSDPDLDYFEICANKLNDLKVKTILDLCCGDGDFVNICTKKYGMEAYGVDPLIITKNNFYKGTIDNVLKNQNLLNNFKFDCISIQNTLHGKNWTNKEIVDIIQFLKKFAKYIVISDPINNPNINWHMHQTKIHSFEGSHGNKLAYHQIYKVN